jgi:hypothetical protein
MFARTFLLASLLLLGLVQIIVADDYDHKVLTRYYLFKYVVRIDF